MFPIACLSVSQGKPHINVTSTIGDTVAYYSAASRSTSYVNQSIITVLAPATMFA